jgi:hypothetical protein
MHHTYYIPYIPTKSSEDGNATRVYKTVLYPHADKNTFVVFFFFCAEKEQATHMHSYQITRHTREKVGE